jgi:hypothetical protein
MPGYFLLRNQELVDKYCDPQGLGAGHLHNLGKPGDILIFDGSFAGRNHVTAYAWQQPQGRSPLAWVRLSLTAQQQGEYKALILLYT